MLSQKCGTAYPLVWHQTSEEHNHLLHCSKKPENSDLHFASALPVIFFYGATAPSGAVPPHYRGFMLTLRHTTLDRTPMNA
jgi:hypothetical protein